MNKMKISNNTIIKRHPDQLLSSKIDEEMVLLSIQKGKYYSLDHTGSEIWEYIHDPIPFSKLIGKLTDNYEVNEEKCIKETKDFLIDLYENGLIKITND